MQRQRAAEARKAEVAERAAAATTIVAAAIKAADANKTAARTEAVSIGRSASASSASAMIRRRRSASTRRNDPGGHHESIVERAPLRRSGRYVLRYAKPKAGGLTKVLMVYSKSNVDIRMKRKVSLIPEPRLT